MDNSVDNSGIDCSAYGVKTKLQLGHKIDDKFSVVCQLLEERINNNRVCLFCGSKHIVKNGKRSGLYRYRCKHCAKTFNAVTGTPMARLRKKELWLEYAQCLLESDTIRNSSVTVNVNSKTGFKWRHRFLNNTHMDEPQFLMEEVEVAEFFFTKSMKGSRKLAKKEAKVTTNGLEKRVSVLFALDREGHEADYITGLGPVRCNWLDRFLTPHISKEALLITEDSRKYEDFSQHQHIEHKVVPLEKAGDGSLKVAEYYYLLISWMERFHGVATKYLNNYLGWCHELMCKGISSSVELIKLSQCLKTPLTGT